METDRLTRWMTLGANFGVLVGLLLLVGEIRQTNSIAKAEAANALTQNYLMFMQMHRDPRQIAAFHRSDGEWEQMNFEERFLIGSTGGAFLKILETAYYQHKFGVYENDQFASDVALLDSGLEQSWVRRIWQQSADSYSEEFRNFVNERLEKLDR